MCAELLVRLAGGLKLDEHVSLQLFHFTKALRRHFLTHKFDSLIVKKSQTCELYPPVEILQ